MVLDAISKWLYLLLLFILLYKTGFIATYAWIKINYTEKHCCSFVRYIIKNQNDILFLCFFKYWETISYVLSCLHCSHPQNRINVINFWIFFSVFFAKHLRIECDSRSMNPFIVNHFFFPFFHNFAG